MTCAGQSVAGSDDSPHNHFRKPPHGIAQLGSSKGRFLPRPASGCAWLCAPRLDAFLYSFQGKGTQIAWLWLAPSLAFRYALLSWRVRVILPGGTFFRYLH